MNTNLVDALIVLLGHPRSQSELLGSAGVAGVVVVLVLGRACRAQDDPLNGPGNSLGASMMGVGMLVGGSLLAAELGLALPGAVLVGLLMALVVLLESKLYGASVRTLVLSWAIALGLAMFSSRMVGAGFDFLEWGSETQEGAWESSG